MSKKISFQGVEGAYSNLAVQEFFPNAESIPCKTFEIAIQKAESGSVDYAMIPIENSAAGRVADIHRLLPKSQLHINYEHFQKVEHKLLIHPDTQLANIKKVISHEQALAQCSEKIQKLDFDILIGADTAGSAKMISENNILEKFDEALHTAGLLATKAKQQEIVFKDVLIAGSIPTRNQTYMAKFELSVEKIFNELQHSGEILNDYVDIFYLDVFSSLEEIKLALKALKKFQKKFLIGVHIKKNNLMDDGHCISQLKDFIDQYDILGVVVACTDQSTVLSVIKKIQNLQVPFGFKVNAFANIPEGWKIKPGNPTESLGVDQSFNSESFISFAEKCRLEGASILGGCCEVLPGHIKALAEFYKN